MYKQDLTLNNLQRLICHRAKPTNHTYAAELLRQRLGIFLHSQRRDGPKELQQKASRIRKIKDKTSQNYYIDASI